MPQKSKPKSSRLIFEKNTDRAKSIIFDMDGTLYEFRGGSFKKSGIHKKIIENAIEYIAANLSIPRDRANIILKNIIKKYGEDISIGLEQEFRLPRKDYFDATWDIDPKTFVRPDHHLRNTLLSLSDAGFNLLLVSDAPRVWITAVLRELNIADYFRKNVFHGEGDLRKGFDNAFQSILKKKRLNPKDCIVIGDQENTDILPAKRLGMKTVRIDKNEAISHADYVVKNINDINPRRMITLLDK